MGRQQQDQGCRCAWGRPSSPLGRLLSFWGSLQVQHIASQPASSTPFQTCLAHSENLATVPFLQPLATKAHPSEMAGTPLPCPSNLAPTLSFAYQRASEKMLTNCRLPEVPRFFCLASIFSLISFAIFVSIVLNFVRFLPRGNFYSSILEPLLLRIYPGNDTIQLE